MNINYSQTDSPGNNKILISVLDVIKTIFQQRGESTLDPTINT